MIDDDEVDIFVTEKMLRLTNFAKYVEVMSFDVGLIRLKNAKDLPDFVFLSLYSGYKTGFDFLKALLYFPREVQKIKVVPLSVSPFHSDEETAWQYEQVVGYFQKPIKISDLQSLYQNQLSQDHE